MDFKNQGNTDPPERKVKSNNAPSVSMKKIQRDRGYICNSTKKDKEEEKDKFAMEKKTLT